MQHHPDAVHLIEAHFEEVVARAERAEMVRRVRLGELRMLVDDRLEARSKRRPGLIRRRRQVRPGALVALGPADGSSAGRSSR
jgi:hypothetical protein